jgi:peptidoglycan biosynthesis protein MviN/MurJ (putative lipid II flippase)
VKGVHVPPFSMPLTAAPEMVLSTALAASLIVSTGLLRATGVVLKRRAWRAICWRNMLIVCVVVVMCCFVYEKLKLLMRGNSMVDEVIRSAAEEL